MYQRLRKGAAKIDPGLTVIFLAALFVIYPFLQPGLPSTADAPIHLLRAAEWGRCWADGVYYPRWAPNLAFGYGYPLFIFAPPLPYVIIQGFHFLGASLETSTKLLPLLCLLLAAGGMYLFVREVMGPRGAVLAAVAYLYAPFQLREALIYGGNYPQLLAVAFFPFILWAIHRLVVTGRALYIVLGAALYGGLILSHNFHALVFSPLLGTYALLLLLIHGKRRRILEVSLTVILGLGLTAIFWLPALYERRWCMAQEAFYLWRSDFHLRFLDGGELLALPLPLDSTAANPYMPFSLGPAALLLALGALIVLALRRGSEGLQVAFFLLVLLAVVFMMLPLSAPIWEGMPFLATAEFPWRFMGLASLAVAFLAGASLHLLEGWSLEFGGWKLEVGRLKWWKEALVLSGCLLLVLLTSAVYLYPPKPFVPYGTPSLAQAVRFEVATQTIGTTTLGEYNPRWVKAVPSTSPLVEDYLAGRPIDKLDREALPQGVRADQLEHTAISDRYRFQSTEPFLARFHTFYFPGWRAYLDGQPVEIEVTEPGGLLAVNVPPGEHQLGLRFESTSDRIIGGVLSLASVLGLGAVAVGAWHFGSARPLIRSNLSPERALPRGQALILSCLLLALFLAKVAVIDPYTTLFRRRSPPGQVTGVEHPAHVNLDDQVLFLGYDLKGDAVRQGEALHLRLYWQALQPLEKNYSSFVHLDARPDFTTQAGSDNPHPGDARAQIDIPTSTWSTETYVRDEHRLEVPLEILPVEYVLRVGLYDQKTNERLAVLNDGGEVVGDAITLQPLQVLWARPPRPSYQERSVLGGKIEFLGYDLSTTELQAGEALEVRLYWRAKAKVERDYTVFMHLLDEGGQVRGQKDSPPVEGAYPTTSWRTGQVVEDRRVIPLTVAPGRYRLAAGMYDLTTLERLEAADGAGERWPDDQIILSREIAIR